MILRASVLLILLALQAASQPEQRYFAYQRQLDIAALDTTAKPVRTCAVLDPALLMHSAPGVPDLRLYQGDQEIPYSVIAGAAPRPRQELAEILNLGLRGNNVTFDAEMPDGKYSTIRMDISAKNFVTTVEVTGSVSPIGVRATKLGTYTLFDLTGEKLDRSTVLHLPESNFHFLHFVVHAPIKPQQIAGVTITGELAESPGYTTISATDVIHEQGHQSVAVVTIPANVPVDRIEFVPGSTPANFSRGVAVAWRSQISAVASSDQADLPMLEKGIIRRIHGVRNGHRIDDEQFTLDPGYATDAVPTRMSIAILNRDDVPLAIDSVRLQMRERKLCFDASKGHRYTLYYGDRDLRAPKYNDTSSIQSGKLPAVATLGAEQANPLWQSRPIRQPLTGHCPALLWIALLVVIAILGSVALRSARRVRL